MKSLITVLVFVLIWGHLQADVETDKAAGTQALTDGQYENAAEIFSKVLEQNPQDGEALYRLGMALMELGRLDQATEQFVSASDAGFQPLGAAYRIARIHARQGRTDEALLRLEEMASGGFPNAQLIEGEKDFNHLKEDSRFVAALETIRTNRYPCKGRAESRQFDFWVADWDVSYLNQPAGSNDVRLILGDCVVFENWESVAGNLGKSFNYYDAGEEHWRQIWVDDTGGVIEFTGQVRQGIMYYTATTHDPATRAPTMHKMTFTPSADGSVNQLWEQSSDNGETWNRFDGHYVKKSD
jgi:tetratricopeptide (TPR) repeat protein